MLHVPVSCIYDYLYKPSINYLDNKINKILKLQSKILGKKTYSVIYKGVRYFPYGFDFYMSDSCLHPSLHAQMDEYIAEFKDIEEEKIEVKRFIDIALSYNYHYDTYVLIFTEPIAKCCLEYSKINFDTKPNIVPEEFINKPSHSLIIEKIRQRIIDNLLMKDIYNES